MGVGILLGVHDFGQAKQASFCYGKWHYQVQRLMMVAKPELGNVQTNAQIKQSP